MSQYSLPGQRKLSFYDSPAMNLPGEKGKKAENKPSERFMVHCYTGADTRIVKKVEQSSAGQTVWNYAYDAKGHLVEVKRNGLLAERYTYSAHGARVKDYRRWCNDSREFSYDSQGRLIFAGGCRFTWSDSGSLRSMEGNGKMTRYRYGKDTRLNTVLLPSGATITYTYSKDLMPVQISRNGKPVMEFGWKNDLFLTRCVDMANAILYTFRYNGNKVPAQASISGPESVVSRITGQPKAHVELHIHADQIGSVRQLTTPEGALVKSIEYDSFGNVMHDSHPSFFFPLGFAGGLVDPFTGFTRFGYRDYDPTVGRFTAKDPLGDTGGDHDLYDYCVDDPVSRFDFTGLDSVNAVSSEEREPDGTLGFWETIYPALPIWNNNNPRHEKVRREFIQNMNRAMVGRKEGKSEQEEDHNAPSWLERVYPALPLWLKDHPRHEQVRQAMIREIGKKALEGGVGMAKLISLPTEFRASLPLKAIKHMTGIDPLEELRRGADEVAKRWYTSHYPGEED